MGLKIGKIRISEEHFLCGQDMEECDIDVDDIFGKKLHAVLADQYHHNPQWFEYDGNEITRPISDETAKHSLLLVPVECGVVLVEKDSRKIVGGYIGCDLVLDETYRGRGLGREIVLDMYLRAGYLPLWDMDTPAYSRAGIAAHRAAWNWGIDRKVIAAKQREFDAPQAEIEIDLSEFHQDFHQETIKPAT